MRNIPANILSVPPPRFITKSSPHFSRWSKPLPAKFSAGLTRGRGQPIAWRSPVRAPRPLIGPLCALARGDVSRSATCAAAERSFRAGALRVGRAEGHRHQRLRGSGPRDPETQGLRDAAAGAHWPLSLSIFR